MTLKTCRAAPVVLTLLALLFAAGCLAVPSAGRAPRVPPLYGNAARPAAPAGLVPGALTASAETAEPALLRVPPLERWPRSMWPSGAAYALVQLNPYVGQLGAVAGGERADAGFGLGVALGYRVMVRGTTALGLEVVYDASEHRNEASHTGARGVRIGAGVRASLRADERLQPFVTVGGGRYALDFGDVPSRFDLAGAGGYVGGGVDWAPSRRASLRGELSVGLWEAADEVGGTGLVATLTLGLGAALSF